MAVRRPFSRPAPPCFPFPIPFPVSFSVSWPAQNAPHGLARQQPCVYMGAAHDGLTGDSRACQRYVQIVVTIPVTFPLSIPIQSSFSRVALCLTEYPRLCLYLYHSPQVFAFAFTFSFPIFTMLFCTSISWYKNILPKAHVIFLHFVCFAFLRQKPRATPNCINTEAGQPSTTHDYPAFFQSNLLSNQTRTLIIIIIIIYPEILGAHLHAHAYTPGHIYPGKTRTRFCYQRPGAPARDHGAGRITPLGKSGYSSF